MPTNIYKKGGAVQIHHHIPIDWKRKKISNQSLFEKKKRNEKPLAVNDQQIMIVCWFFRCDDGGYIAAEIFDAHYI